MEAEKFDEFLEETGGIGHIRVIIWLKKHDKKEWQWATALYPKHLTVDGFQDLFRIATKALIRRLNKEYNMEIKIPGEKINPT